jgi:hypothetical protein
LRTRSSSGATHSTSIFKGFCRSSDLFFLFGLDSSENSLKFRLILVDVLFVKIRNKAREQEYYVKYFEKYAECLLETDREKLDPQWEELDRYEFVVFF